MNYTRFEDVPAWKDAALLAAVVFRITARVCFRGQGDVANQLQRAGLSISNNIAEGFERGTTQELVTFLYYARGSAGEVRSILCVMEMVEVFKDLKSEISDLKSIAESISRQIRAWAESLQESPIRGQRYLTDRSEQAYHHKRQADAYWDKAKQDHEERLRRLAVERRTQASGSMR